MSEPSVTEDTGKVRVCPRQRSHVLWAPEDRIGVCVSEEGEEGIQSSTCPWSPKASGVAAPTSGPPLLTTRSELPWRVAPGRGVVLADRVIPSGCGLDSLLMTS